MKYFLLHIFTLVGYQVIKTGMFCSMLYVLFSPQTMWIYLACLLIIPLLIAIPKAIIEVRRKKDEQFEKLFQHI